MTRMWFCGFLVLAVPFSSGFLQDTNSSNKTGKLCLLQSDCKFAFSECHETECYCTHGFIFKNETCVPKRFDCPFGEPVQLNEQPIKCERSQADPVTLRKADRPVIPRHSWTDDCPTGNFCLLTDQISGQLGLGFCCPKPKPTCPIGEPMPNARCPSETTYNSCPSTTHQCLSLNFGAQQILNTCCPRPCSSGDLYIDGKCWSKVRIGDICRYSVQCPTNADCSEEKCLCKKGFIESGLNYCSKPYCPGGPKALDPQLDNNGRPLKCGGQNATCPANSYCDGNGKFCCPTPPPYCSTIQSYVSSNDRCQLTIPNQCGQGKTCISWYTAALEITGHQKQTFGLCCPLSNSVFSG